MHKKTASNEWGGEPSNEKRIIERLKNGGNSLPVFSQNSDLGRSTLHPLVVEGVHGAKLPAFFEAQYYLFTKKPFCPFQEKRLSAVHKVFKTILG